MVRGFVSNAYGYSPRVVRKRQQKYVAHIIAFLYTAANMAGRPFVEKPSCGNT